ncbi:hypothetical protein CMI42_04365 [Candidatus Pacearchaeota archaeon]|nr:hypothetical protein [Candidatus Pacearchaeota archaeon]
MFLTTLILAISLTPGEKQLIKECKKNCSYEKINTKELIKKEYKTCKTNCRNKKSQCIIEQRTKQSQCLDQCLENHNLKETEDKKEYNKLKRSLKSCQQYCKKDYSKDKRACSHKTCSAECREERKKSSKENKEDYRECRNQCPYKILERTCENGRYNAGESFKKDCQTCTCNLNGKVVCSTSPFCHLTPLQDETTCINSRGTHTQICQGTNARIRCTKEKFCLCSENSCPQNNTCLKEFKIELPSPLKDTYTDLLGRPIKDIGICAS